VTIWRRSGIYCDDFFYRSYSTSCENVCVVLDQILSWT